jgi:hypothetical protein
VLDECAFRDQVLEVLEGGEVVFLSISLSGAWGACGVFEGGYR